MPLKRYADFSGRSRRKEYWLFFLFCVVGQIVTTILDIMFALGGTAASGGLLTLLFTLATLIPSIAVSVRRAHDQDKSGWFILIPIYGFILMFFDGTRGPNRFGEDPKGPDYMETFA